MLKTFLLLVVLSAVWGAGYTINKVVMVQGMALWSYAFFMAIGPAVLLLLVCRLAGISFCFSFIYWRYYCFTALLGIVIPNTNLYFVAPHLSAGELAIIANTVPIIIFPLALLSKLEAFSFRRLVGVLLGMLGVGIIIFPSIRSTSLAIMRGWFLLALLSPLCYALCTIYIAKYRPANSHSLSLSAGMLLLSSLLIAPLVLVFHRGGWGFHLSDQLIGLVCLQIIFSSIGYVLIFELIRLAGPICYSVVSILTVLMAIFWGWLFLAEPLTWYALVAMFFIFSAILLVSLRRNTRKF